MISRATSEKPKALEPISIVTTSLSKRFNREWIFRNFTHTFSSGNTYAITGANGSGKSTLLQILWGQTPPTSGEIKYYRCTEELDGEQIFKSLTIATPYMDLIEEFTLEEQLKFHFSLRKSRGLSIDEMIDTLYLGKARHKFISNFSSGMRQRVKLGLAFFTEADIIFLDEPSTNLDQQAFEWYRKQLHLLPPTCMVLIASNQSSEYPESAHKIDIMQFK
ncbi:ABC transporter ATP-binding protein [Pseudochryseolinea flava]|uniref:ABC transporter ATP-binding protein n=1 Tax=Pseudochryseolinea flava TaxID=2059302 RepID=A0A364XYW4_9BACT|nr:ATP-binding cassette domain-containing protein [Pseudochryseolinea flava]RAV98785.1 ABC transporter ATP-binding protein [Pseudochryseolinea flava]